MLLLLYYYGIARHNPWGKVSRALPAPPPASTASRAECHRSGFVRSIRRRRASCVRCVCVCVCIGMWSYYAMTHRCETAHLHQRHLAPPYRPCTSTGIIQRYIIQYYHHYTLRYNTIADDKIVKRNMIVSIYVSTCPVVGVRRRRRLVGSSLIDVTLRRIRKITRLTVTLAAVCGNPYFILERLI